MGCEQITQILNLFITIFFYLRNPPKADKSAKSVDKLLSIVAVKSCLKKNIVLDSFCGLYSGC